MPRYLGQHFLKNKKKLQEIIDALDLKNGDIVVEIGPGKGALTIPLAEKCRELNCKIIAIEKDKYFVNDLKSKICDLGIKNVEIIEGDALKIIPSIPKTHNLKPNTYKIVGNIPYYITGYLFRILGELATLPQQGEPRLEILGRGNKPELIVLLIQKEVAERVCAGKGDMNLLATSVQFWAELEIISYVSKNDFSPPPKVESAIIKLIPFNTITCDSIEKEKYYRFIKILFKQPRKTIVNNLVSSIKYQVSGVKKEEIIKKLQKIGMGANARPQNLSIEQIKKLLE